MNRAANISARFSPAIYTTAGGVTVFRHITLQPFEDGTQEILENLNYKKGALFSSSYDYPGRYTRWDIGFVDPCLELRSCGRHFTLKALKEKGIPLLKPMYRALAASSDMEELLVFSDHLEGRIKPSPGRFPEEERSRQPSIFSVLRSSKKLLGSEHDQFLGFYGAFGYDLVFQFEDLKMKHRRDDDSADLCLYLPDQILIIDHRMVKAFELSYDFEIPDINDGLSFSQSAKSASTNKSAARSVLPLQKGRYAGLVREAKEYFFRGDLFEVVPSQALYEPCEKKPSLVFETLRSINPSPYGFMINLGDEHLIGASPEMYVRVEKDRVETCPISGTIARGGNALEDAEQIRTLLNSYKDESELTMCTDVDRNDKSRICVPGSVQVIGRRQIELYSHLIHTVDHVQGRLQSGYDSLDAFLTHMWAVTVTGAPKKAALQWVEDHEEKPRGWYAGAVGYFAFNGDLNTGLTLRTISLKDGLAEIRVGATLLADSIPEAEEEETYLKAAALKKAISYQMHDSARENSEHMTLPGQGKKVLLVDHEDSFVHTLASYFRTLGARVSVARPDLARDVLQSGKRFDLMVLSPGPGRPRDFDMNDTIRLSLERKLPIFGVCLGLQGLVEFFGGTLDQLPFPHHGKASVIENDQNSPLWVGLPSQFKVGRYHSLYGKEIPDCLKVAASTQDGVPMAIEHRDLPVYAVQFHPESILTSSQDNGLKIIDNLVRTVCGQGR